MGMMAHQRIKLAPLKRTLKELEIVKKKVRCGGPGVECSHVSSCFNSPGQTFPGEYGGDGDVLNGT